jgi:uncharacterized protein YpmS
MGDNFHRNQAIFEMIIILLICLNQVVLIYLFIKFSRPMFLQKVEENASDCAKSAKTANMYDSLTETTDSKFANYISDNILLMSTD